MSIFRVWAPQAARLELLIAGDRMEMAADGTGFWHIDVPAAGAGTDYAYVIDGGTALPDPRSRWQPQGVHGPSRVLDQNGYTWSDDHWQPPPLSSAIIYEMHVGTFTKEGTFESVITHLDHLVNLGITHLELLPVNEFPGSRGWGYDGVDFFAPYHVYGGPLGLKRLVDACHSRGLAVILDVVYNHLGPAGNYLGQFGPYFNDKYSTVWGPAINYDGPNSDEVRRFVCDNVLMWLRDYHFDALRLDAVHAIFDTSAVHILEQMAEEVRELSAQLGRNLYLIAESDLNDPRLIRPFEIGGYNLDAQWSDDFHHALHALLTGEINGYYADFGTCGHLAKAMRQAFVYDGIYSANRLRRHGRPPTQLSGHRFLAYLQNHDQIGNRAQGERSSHLMSTGKLKIGTALVMTSPFIPMLFQGEEWAASTPFQYFTDHEDPDLGEAVRTGRREEFVAFGWKPEEVPDPQARETFERSKLHWREAESGHHAELLDWHRSLIRLRRSRAELTDGRMDRVLTRYDETAGWFVMERGLLSIICNLSPRPQSVPLGPGRIHNVLMQSAPEVADRRDQVDMPPESVVILGPQYQAS